MDSAPALHVKAADVHFVPQTSGIRSQDRRRARRELLYAPLSGMNLYTITANHMFLSTELSGINLYTNIANHMSLSINRWYRPPHVHISNSLPFNFSQLFS